MKTIPNAAYLFILLVILLLCYTFGGHDATTRDMMLGTFTAALALLRPPDAAVGSVVTQPSQPIPPPAFVGGSTATATTIPSAPIPALAETKIQTPTA